MGHQFDAEHTFNGVNGNCGGNIGGATTVEPGSGSTIMAYAGICGADNLQPHSDPYFSQLSIDEITAYVAGAPSHGGTAVATANHSPVVTAPAGFTIPTRTPFALTGAGSDADGNPLTYLWEQNDAGSGTSLFSNTKPERAAVPGLRHGGQRERCERDPLARRPARTPPAPTRRASSPTSRRSSPTPRTPPPASARPATSPASRSSSRRRPTPTRCTSGSPRATAAGGVSHADTTLTLAKSAGPFRITSQPRRSASTRARGSTLTWNVADTNVAPVGAANVRITLSTDGGLTFPRVVLKSTPNDGSQTVLLPEASGSTRPPADRADRQRLLRHQRRELHDRPRRARWSPATRPARRRRRSTPTRSPTRSR